MSAIEKAAQGHGIWEVPGTKLDPQSLSSAALEAISKILAFALTELRQEGLIYSREYLPEAEADIRQKVLGMVDEVDPVR